MLRRRLALLCVPSTLALATHAHAQAMPNTPAADAPGALDPAAPPTASPNPVPPATPPPANPVRITTPLAGAPAIGLRRVDVGAKVSDRFVMPSGYAEVGGELAFVTSGAIVTPSKVAFGDMALFRPSARRSFGDELELSLGTTWLAKEPSGEHAWIWQGASVGAVYEPAPGGAVVLDAAGGPLLHGQGSFWSAAPGLSRKWALDGDTRAVLSLSDDFTALDRRGELGARAWLDELVLGGEVELGHRDFAFWVGADYGVPVAKHGEQPLLPGVPLRPTTRLDLQVGSVLRVGRHESWDLFAYYAWIDRGEANRPSTLLPIVDGGFDQQQVVLGVRHRFEPPGGGVMVPEEEP